MASPGLEDQLQGLTIKEDHEADGLPFLPPPDMRPLQDKFHEIPRYLFRVSTPFSQGTTTSSWVKSMEAKEKTANSRVDIFANHDRPKIARMINSHFRWWHDPGDNLVSWTSSLLFALAYIFYLQDSDEKGSMIENIWLHIIDTSELPENIFLCDLDLIRCFSKYDPRRYGLHDFECLRLNKTSPFGERYYFGEYLSQGALKIDGKCQKVSAQRLMDHGLSEIRPEFGDFARRQTQEKPQWTRRVLEIRRSLRASDAEQPGIREKRLQAVRSISQLFEPSWTLVVAAHLFAIAAPYIDDEKEILEFIRPYASMAFEQTPDYLVELMTVAHDTMPEVQKAASIIESAYRDWPFGELIDSLRELLRSLNALRQCLGT